VNDKIDELLKNFGNKINHNGKGDFYEEIIDSCQFSLNPKKNFEQKTSLMVNISNVAVALLFLVSAMLIYTKDPECIKTLFISQIIFGIIVLILTYFIKNKGYLITKEDKIIKMFDKIYSVNPNKWIEFETYITTKYNIDTIGNPIKSKHIPYVLTSLSFSYIVKLLPDTSKSIRIHGIQISAEYIVIFLMLGSFMFFIYKSFNHRRIDKLEFLIKAMANFDKLKK